jgi:hypothetical protein
MIARLRYAKQLFDAGLLELRGLIAGTLDIASKLAVFAALSPGMLPDVLKPYHTQLVTIGQWAVGVSFLAGLLVMQSKRAIPQLPLTGAPSLLDDETGR